MVQLRFLDANPSPTIAGVDRLPGLVNDLRGKDRTRWRTKLATYAGVVYGQLYPGIDVRYDGVDGRIKSTYTIAPGADRPRFAGATMVPAISNSTPAATWC